MNKIVMIALSMSLGACATTYERCTQMTSNPYEIDNPATITTKELKELYLSKYADKMTPEEFSHDIQAKTRFEWQAYGSIQQCMARKDASDQAVVNNFVAGYELADKYNSRDIESLRRSNEEFYKKPAQVNVYIKK